MGVSPSFHRCSVGREGVVPALVQELALRGLEIDFIAAYHGGAGPTERGRACQAQWICLAGVLDGVEESVDDFIGRSGRGEWPVELGIVAVQFLLHRKSTQEMATRRADWSGAACNDCGMQPK